MEVKKNKSARLDLHSRTFFLVGLVITMSLILLAFEYKSYYKIEKFNNNVTEIVWDDPQVENTVRPKPPKPKNIITDFIIDKTNKIETKDDYVSMIDDPEDMDWESIIDYPEEEPEIEPIVEIPEKMASFPGGDDALRKFLAENLIYPEEAKLFNIQGTVYVRFTIGSDGTVKDIKVIRSVDLHLDAESIRVVSKMPKWEPAQQGVRKVATYIHLPFRYSLAD